jgi:hypothetical protein
MGFLHFEAVEYSLARQIAGLRPVLSLFLEY